MLTYILIGLAVVIVIFLIVASAQSSEFRVSRSTTVAAPAATVFGNVNDLHNWKPWSPWMKLDLNAKSVHEGAPAGVGASMSWAGNRQVGEGKMTIIESRPAELIRIKLEFFKPFKAVNTGEFTFKTEGDQTVVTWSMYGPNKFMGKVMGLIINCDKMIGCQFEKGLRDLKAIAENAKA